MGAIGEMIVHAAGVAARYQKRLVTGVPENLFARFAAPGGVVVSSNHPAFILGHLSLYPAKAIEYLGGTPLRSKPSDRFDSVFSKDHQCLDDVEGTFYPSMNEVLDFYDQAYEEAFEAIRACEDSALMIENPNDGPIKKVCPTLASMLAFYMDGHVMMHLGQFSAWRRMQGLPPC